MEFDQENYNISNRVNARGPSDFFNSEMLSRRYDRGNWGITCLAIKLVGRKEENNRTGSFNLADRRRRCGKYVSQIQPLPAGGGRTKWVCERWVGGEVREGPR